MVLPLLAGGRVGQFGAPVLGRPPMVPQEEPGEGRWGWETVREWESVEGTW